MPLLPHVKAHAKINLFLNLLGPRPDGFHAVRFVMQTLDLADTLTIEEAGSGLSIAFACGDPALETPDNLVVKAYHRFYESTGLPPRALTVRLEKGIPVQAGLGGGSSDAAAMLEALNALHQHPLSREALHALAAPLGSDVPFFLYGGTAVATGRGEIITPVAALPPWEVAVLKPRHLGISTPQAYQWVREANAYHTQDFGAWEALFHAGSSATMADLAPLLWNDFEATLFPRYPMLTEAKRVLLALGLPGALLSGSGPAIFGLMDQAETQWPSIEARFPENDWQRFRCRFCP